MNWIYAHLIGDYLMQTDWMANGKKTNWRICVVHVATYLIPFLFTPLVAWQIIAIAVEHFIQDTTQIVPWFMRVKRSAGFIKPPCGPWSVILTDNILHVLFMAWIASL